MSTVEEQKSFVQRIKEAPSLSAVSSGIGVLSLTNVINLGLYTFLSPFASGGNGIAGALDLFDRSRSGLSRTFSGVAAATGIGGALMPLAISGPDGLGAFYIALGTMTVSGACNVASYHLRDKKIPFSISVKRNNNDAQVNP